MGSYQENKELGEATSDAYMLEVALEIDKTNSRLAEAVLDMVMGTFESKSDEIYGVRVKPYLHMLAVMVAERKFGGMVVERKFGGDEFHVPTFWPKAWMNVFVDAGFIESKHPHYYVLTPLGKRAIVAYHLTTDL